MFGVRTTLTDLVEICNDSSWIYVTLVLFLAMISFIIFRGRREVFLLDFACYKPPSTQTCNKDRILKMAKFYFKFTDAALEMTELALERSGLGDSTYVSEGLLKDPPIQSIHESRRESQSVMFGAVDELLAKTGVKSKDIRIVIVTCTLFNVVPSLVDMIVNRYQLNENVSSYNITGMGCSAGLSAINLAKNLLQVHQDSYALVYSTETITQNIYMGEEPSMLIANTLFRIGGVAVLLSNRPSDHHLAKYKLVHSVQTNTSSSDKSYKCIFHEEDDQGNVGIRISKDLKQVAVNAMQSNITTVGHLVLPMSEKILLVTNYVMRYFHGSNIQRYIPRFNRAIDHVFAHVGAKPVLDAVEKRLGFSKTDLEPSRMALYKFGNTSSSSVWYALAYAEAKRRIKLGDRLWQLAYGSGFKCSSVIWCALKSIDFEENNPWSDEIDGFPVDLQHIVSDEMYLEPLEN